MPKSKRSKACDIPPKVKRAVLERDGGLCVVCFRSGIPNAHYIPRSLGGLGIEENIVTLCDDCHRDYDNGYNKDINLRKEYGEIIRAYLDKHYPDFPKDKRFYNRWVR